MDRVYIYIVYKARKYHVPQDIIYDILQAILGINFSVTRTKVKAEYKAIKSILNIQSSKIRKRTSHTLS